MKPDPDYLRLVAAGEIVVTVENRPRKGNVWRATKGLALLRLHEEAGLVAPLVTARWAGIPAVMYGEGARAKLTDAGLALIAR